MIDEATQDTATMFVMGDLTPEQATHFAGRMRADGELRELVDDLSESVAALAHTVAPLAPPPALRERILRDARSGKIVKMPSFTEAGRARPWMPWAVAAGLAVACTLLFTERQRMKSELDWLHVQQSAAKRDQQLLVEDGRTLIAERERLSQQLVALEKRDALAQVKIATLSAQLGAYSKATAVVVWDGNEQRGVVKFEKLPALAKGKDYQLWVIDPKSPGPVSAGVVSTSGDGITQVAFRPDQRVGTAEKFALSVERTGGSPAPAGPIVLISQ